MDFQFDGHAVLLMAPCVSDEVKKKKKKKRAKAGSGRVVTYQCSSVAEEDDAVHGRVKMLIASKKDLILIQRETPTA